MTAMVDKDKEHMEFFMENVENGDDIEDSKIDTSSSSTRDREFDDGREVGIPVRLPSLLSSGLGVVG